MQLAKLPDNQYIEAESDEKFDKATLVAMNDGWDPRFVVVEKEDTESQLSILGTFEMEDTSKGLTGYIEIGLVDMAPTVTEMILTTLMFCV
jgi:hypothetical protein